MPWDDEEDDDLSLREPASRMAQDPDFRIKVLKWFWLIALLMMLFGYVIMLMVILGRSPFG